MKKLLLFFSIILLGGTAFGQGFTLGLKAGINIAKLNTDFADEENRLGYQVGAWARLGAGGLYLQPEAYLGSKNNELKFTQSNNTVEGKANFTTLDIPLLLGTKVGPKNFNVRFMAGPVLSLVVDKNTTFNSAANQVGDFDNYKNQAWGGQIGAGVDLGNLAIDLRYEAGLSNISESDQYDQKQNLWHISLGYKLF
ncbi:porin family protein [Rubrolithibacter danxiaensis]|uniref:porin family protein n=1 Tax=Rubrolithibacter danxiaensis TaxID=3390805 RepID=UPI003BF7CDA1